MVEIITDFVGETMKNPPLNAGGGEAWVKLNVPLPSAVPLAVSA